MPDYIIDDKNYATDDKLAQRALDWLTKVCLETRQHRSVLDMRYMQFYNIYRCNFDIRFYEGTSQVYIPQLRKYVESYVAKLNKALFPTDDLLDAEPTQPEMLNEEEVITTFMQWQMEKRIKLRTKMPRFLRQHLMYGWSPVKCVWQREVKKVVGLEKEEQPIYKIQRDPVTNIAVRVPTGKTRTRVYQTEKKLIKYNNPTFDVLDIFAWFMYPVTANSVDEAVGCFEVSKQRIADLKLKGEPNTDLDEDEPDYANTEKLSTDQDKSDGTMWDWAQQQRLITDGLTDVDQTQTFPSTTFIEYWGKFDWSEEQDGSDIRDTVISTAGNNRICLQLRKNPFFDQEKPYLQSRYSELQNEAYPSGLFEPLASLQYYLNDTLNQTFDCILYELNPIIKYDPGRVVNANSIAFAPGAMWALTDPTAAVFERPQDVSQIGFTAAQQAKQIMDDYPGMMNIPLVGRKAATHIQAIETEYSMPVIEVAQNIEMQVLDPWVKKAYTRNQQFITDEEVFYVTGKRGVKYWARLSPEQLAGDYNFSWKGSSQSTNIHVKTQQKLQFLQAAAPLQPLLQQEGVKLSVSKILRSVWSDGFGFDGGDMIIEEIASDRGIDPNVENMLIDAGKYITVSQLDDDKMHLQVHNQALTQINPYAVKLMQRHMGDHQFALQQKAQAGGQGNIGTSGQTDTPMNESQVGNMMKNEFLGLRSQHLSNQVGNENMGGGE